MLRRAAVLAFPLLAVLLLHPPEIQAQEPEERPGWLTQLLESYEAAFESGEEECDEIWTANREWIEARYRAWRSALGSARSSYLAAQSNMRSEAERRDDSLKEWANWFMESLLNIEHDVTRPRDPQELEATVAAVFFVAINRTKEANERFRRSVNELLEARANLLGTVWLYLNEARCLETRRSELAALAAGAQPSPEPAPRPAGDPEEETPYRNRGDWSVNCPGGALSGAMWLWGDRLTNKFSILSVDLQGPGLPDTDLRIFGQVDWGGPVGRPPPLGTSTRARLAQKAYADLQAPGGPPGEEAFVFYGTVTLDGVEGSWPVVSGGGQVRVLRSDQLARQSSEDDAVCEGTWTVY